MYRNKCSKHANIDFKNINNLRKVAGMFNTIFDMLNLFDVLLREKNIKLYSLALEW